MFDSFERDMNERERRLLEDRINWSPPKVGLATLKALATGALALVVIVALAFSLSLVSDWNGLWTAIAGVLGFAGLVCVAAMVLTLTDYPTDRALERSYERDKMLIRRELDANRVVINEVKPLRVAVICEHEDEGDVYLFDIGEDRTLALSIGQIDAWVDQDSQWPNTAFYTARTAGEHRLIGLFCDGEELTPVRTLEATDCEPEVFEEREEVIEQRLEEYIDSILTPKTR